MTVFEKIDLFAPARYEYRPCWKAFSNGDLLIATRSSMRGVWRKYLNTLAYDGTAIYGNIAAKRIEEGSLWLVIDQATDEFDRKWIKLVNRDIITVGWVISDNRFEIVGSVQDE